ncbi:hypothetical protein X943_002188 [Babesia divergens]|uniref:Uncharacterized protein n=1 Tax=Babesia divergens TaxID=32595 RepID=A0AAD9G791_BABDI|nr:hypothetical protein X943_002188 [Babesia divergens]
MRLLPHMTTMCFVTAPGNNVDDNNGDSGAGFYVTRYFGFRRRTANGHEHTAGFHPSRCYYERLEGPYYNRDFEAEDYEEILKAEKEEEEEEMDDIDRQLMELEAEKRLYKKLNRMVKRSAEMEMPKTQVETQAMFPPGNPNDEAANKPPEEITLSKLLLEQAKATDKTDNGDDAAQTTADNANDFPIDGQVGSGTKPTQRYSEEELERLRAEVPPLKSQFDSYDPIKLPGPGNTTSELITGIIQMPNVKDIKGLQESFKVKDYTENDSAPIPEDNIWLEAVNEERRKCNKPEIKLEEGQKPSDHPDFVKEVREVRLKQMKDLRSMAHKARENREALKHTFYRKLPRNEMGFAQLEEADIDKLLFEEVKEELRARGHRTGGGEKMARIRLAHALKETDDWRYRNIVQQPLDETNENLPDHSREKIIELKQKLNLIEEAGWGGDMNTAIARLKARQDFIRFKEDPVGYLELDRDEPDRDVTPEEAEEMRNAPVVHDMSFIEAMENPINRLPDIIPRTFNLQPDLERPYPQYHAMHKEELEQLKKEYLSFHGGIHEETLPEISRRYEISLDFLGDACCRLGARPPVSLDMPLRGIISYSAMWDLIEFLNIADTVEVETFYTFLDIENVASELGKSVDEVVNACDRLGIKLPFGIKTKLNVHCLTMVEKLVKNPELDTDELVHDPSYRDPFEDYTDKRPAFPNSMQDEIYQAAVENKDVYDETKPYA